MSFLILPSSVTRPKMAIGGVARLNVVSASTTYGAADTVDAIMASGASFTITLYTAVGNTGRVISIFHQGTSGTQVYTVVGTGGQTIGGLAQETLNVNGHMLQLISNGTNWLILNRTIKRDFIQCKGYNGYGSTNTRIPRWDSVYASSLDNGLFTAVTDSSTLGNSFTFSRACYVRAYATWTSPNTATNNYLGFSLNSNQLTTDINSITAANRLWMVQTTPSTTVRGAMPPCWEGFLAANDVFRVHADNQAPNGDIDSNFVLTAEVLN